MCAKITVIVNDLKKTHGETIDFTTAKVGDGNSVAELEKAKVKGHGIIAKDKNGSLVTKVDGHSYGKDKVEEVIAMLLPAKPAGEGWIDLLQNDSMDLWQPGAGKNAKNSKPIGEAWTLADGVLRLDREPDADGKKKRGGFIVTKEVYRDFELKFEFRIAHNGNSGVKYWTNAEGLGLEYQIIDDVNYRDNKNPTHRTAAIYDLVAADEEKKKLGTPGKDWNSGRIVAKDNKVEHWVNGQLVTEVEFGSADWQVKYAKSKYRDIEGFAAEAGAILLQDHGDSVSFRNVHIREL